MNNAIQPVGWKTIALKWWPVLLGLLVLYAPTFNDAAHGIWDQEEHAHGPLIFMVVLYLFWQQKEVLFEDVGSRAAHAQSGIHPIAAPSFAATITGWVFLVIGLLFYALGRSQEIIIFEIGSLIPAVLGTVLITRGCRVTKALWFPIFFILFMIPLPGQLVDALTGPLKRVISEIAEILLYKAGYPVARSGVVISVGPYQLLVADACSGLHSMFSLSALGLLYVHLMQYQSRLRNVLIIASILPIAFTANIIRVMVIALVTYHFGDEAGQGFIHGFAGIFLFMTGLLFLFLLDSILGKIRFFQNTPKADEA